MAKDYSKLSRPKNEMPGFVKKALLKKDLMEAFKKRPEYQQNDYLGWIKDAKLESTKMKRLQQMLDELDRGGIYMNMDHPPSKKEL